MNENEKGIKLDRFFSRKRLNAYLDKQMNDKDNLTLSPIQKFRKYKKFPFKMILHFILVIIITTQALLIHSIFTMYRRSTYKTFDQVFTPHKYSEDGLKTTVDFLSVLNRTVVNYYDFPTNSIEEYGFIINSNVINPIDMSIEYFSLKSGGDAIINQFKSQEIYKLDLQSISNTSVGPFNITNTKDVISYLQKLTCSFQYKNTAYSIVGKVSYIWNIQVIFDFAQHGGKVFLSTESTPTIDPSKESSENDIIIFKILNSLLFSISSILLILGLKRIILNFILLGRAKERFNQLDYQALSRSPYNKWEDIPRSIKIKFINLWNLSNMVGNLGIVFATAITLGKSPGISSTEYYRIFIGIGSFISSINLMKYLTYNERLYTLILTIEKSLSRSARFIFSCFPIVFGYVLCGVSLFSEYSEEVN